jgi:hypothetical protein
MSVKSLMEFVENKAEILQNTFAKPSNMNTWFFAGAASIAFGLAVGVPVVREAGVMMLAAPAAVCGLCQVAKFSARVVKRYAPEP